MEAESKPKPQKSPRTRSPNFPSINLERAIGRANELYSKSGTHAVSLSALGQIWDYKPKSSSFQKAIAALKAFGLLNIEGAGDNRKVAISETGEHIIDKAPDAATLVKEAALKAKLFSDMWHKYREKGIPSDDTFRDHLRWDKELGFNKASIDTFIENFKATITYAKLDNSDIMPPEEGDGGNEPPGGATPKPPTIKPPQQEAGMKTLSFALVEGDATIQVPHPMTDESFEMLLGILKLQRPALVPMKETQKEPENNG